MDELRSLAQEKIRTGLPALGMPHCEHGCEENYDATYMLNLTDRFQLEFWPPNFLDKVTIEEFLGQLTLLRGIHREGEACRHCESRSRVSGMELKSFAAEVEKECQGLCLDCVREDRHVTGECWVTEHPCSKWNQIRLR